MQGPEESPAASCDGDREKIRLCERLRGLAETLGCRTNLRLARPLPAAGKRLRKSIPQCFGVPPPRIHPPHATKALFSQMNFPDRLLSLSRPILRQTRFFAFMHSYSKQNNNLPTNMKDGRLLLVTPPIQGCPNPLTYRSSHSWRNP